MGEVKSEWFETPIVWQSADATCLAALQNNQRVGERYPSLAAMEARESTELVKLREENARLKALCEEQHADLMGPEEIKRACKVATGPWESENHSLQMQLADSQGCYDDVNARLSEAQVELEFCKREIARLDPRLHAARWGRR